VLDEIQVTIRKVPPLDWVDGQVCGEGVVFVGL
jgi:hypothetical protein